MIKPHTLLLLVLAASIGFVSTQDVLSPTDTVMYDATEGSMYRHVYSTAVYYSPNPTLATVNSTLAINKTMIVGLFDTTETITYGTGKRF